mgnify:CR=1 FL=1
MTGPFDLSGRTALVTGARGGIGQAIAVALARAGADLVIHGHRGDLAETEAGLGLACVDPYRQGAGRLVDALV